MESAIGAREQLQRNQPTVLIIRVLEACNAGCFMCSFKWSKDQYRFPISEAAQLAKSAAEIGIRVVRLTGGEPLLHEQIDEIISLFCRQDLLTSIITNGALLQEKSQLLANAGLTQVIVSLDGHREGHDRCRNSPGLFDAAVAGLRMVKREASHVKTRVNTVVGPHNFRLLPTIYDLLCEIGVESWSIIPLKDPNGAWKYVDRNQVESEYIRFREYVGRRPLVRILGYSLQWLGRNGTEINRYLEDLKVMTPRGRCQVVQTVRYYIPKEGKYYPCNCVPHRMSAMTLAQQWGPDSLSAAGLGAAGEWLRINGPGSCSGCEPVNAALGEGAIDLDADPLGF
jgi:cytosylglucuronate decarboxylase